MPRVQVWASVVVLNLEILSLRESPHRLRHEHTSIRGSLSLARPDDSLNRGSNHPARGRRVSGLDNVNVSADSAGISTCLFPVNAPPTKPPAAPTSAPIPAPFPPPAKPPISAPPAAPPPVVAAVLLPFPFTVLSSVPVLIA